MGTKIVNLNKRSKIRIYNYEKIVFVYNSYFICSNLTFRLHSFFKIIFSIPTLLSLLYLFKAALK